MKIGAEFSGRWKACWITTYTFDPAFFGTFLLPRLGEPPLNAVVLADFGKLAELWSGLDPQDLSSIAAVNRAYLMQPVELSGVLHAKTIFLANEREGVLLVGSGNVRLEGLERGNEVYSRFEWRRDEPDGAFGVWRAWMAELVARADASLLWARWADLLTVRAPWLAAAPSDDVLVTNWHRSLLDQLTSGVVAPCDEVRLTAPFFDSDLGALRSLLGRTRPHRVVLYLGENTKVDGRRLERELQTVEDVSILEYAPSDYVHAKLFAWTKGEGARLLSGSANLTGAALLRTVGGEPGANAEVGVISDLRASDLDAIFTPPAHTAQPVSIDRLQALTFESEPSASLGGIHLLQATRDDSGRVAVACDPARDGLTLTDGASRAQVVGRETSEPFPTNDGPVLVWLESDDGDYSNLVPLADARLLAGMLQQREGSSERPREIDLADIDHPLGQLLASLHQTIVFDLRDIPTIEEIERKRREAPEAEAPLADRLISEVLAQDPRLARYRIRSGSGPRGDELSWLLDEMLAKAPAPNVVRVIGGVISRPEVEGEGRAWSPSARLAFRVFNVLSRWSLALTDYRVAWRNEYEFAQVRHFEYLAAAIAQIWAQRDWMPEPRLATLVLTLLGAFCRTERSVGYLGGIPEPERSSITAALAAGPGPGLAAGFAYLALRKANAQTFFEWQPVLEAALTWGVLVADDHSSDLVEAATDNRPTPLQIEDRLTFIAGYEDDEHWQSRRAERFGFTSVRIARSGNYLFPVELTVQGTRGVLSDPRLVGLVRDALAYRHESGIRLRAGADLLAIALGKLAHGAVAGAMVSSTQPIDMNTITGLEAAGQPFGVVMDVEAAASTA